MAAEYGVDYLGALPLNLRIREQADSGRPTVVADPDGEIAAHLQGGGAPGGGEDRRSAPRTSRPSSRPSRSPRHLSGRSGLQALGCSCCSSSSVLALKKAAASSKGTMTQRCSAVQRSTLRCPLCKKASRLGSRPVCSRQNTGWVLQLAVVDRRGHRDLGLVACQRCGHPRHQVDGEVGAVAGHAHQVGRGALRQPGRQPGQRAGIVGQRIGAHRRAHRRVGVQVAVGIDQQGADLWRQPLQRMLGQRPALMQLQAFVHAPHAAAAAAGQHQAGDLLPRRRVQGLSRPGAPGRAARWGRRGARSRAPAGVPGPV